MEPRITTLLEDSPVDRSAANSLARLPPPSAAPRRPHPVEPTTANDHARPTTTSAGSSLLGQSHTQHSPNQQTATQRQKPNASIANILNTVTPFSGRLSDLLLDPSQQQAPKRKRDDESGVEPQPPPPPPPAGPENSLLTLPKPNQQPKRSNRRRIPPLLQGLHQVPPQAQSRLFPPITSKSSSFGRDIGDGAGLRTADVTDKRKEHGAHTASESHQVVVVGEAQKSGGKPASTTTSDKENRTAPDRSKTSSEKAAKELRRRNKWTEKETKDLLVGVSRFGIGNWKKILQCPDFTFHNRTAVDLKDRFRTCCPGEGLKPRKTKRKSFADDESSQCTSASSTTTSMSSNHDPAAQETLHTINTLRKNRGDTHRKGPAELREMGIHGTFAKSNRRERRVFTEQDDESLLKGFEKYGSMWHLMRDDGELGFANRQATDLRDRFRIRYPERFAKAGHKLKPKDERMLKEKEQEMRDRETPRNQNSDNREHRGSTHSNDDTSFSSLTSTASSSSNLMPLVLRESFLTSFSRPLEDFGDMASEQDGDNNRSPVILNRNIFEWADANPSQMSAITSANLPSMGTLASDAPLNIYNASENMHINPSLTLNLPMALLNSNVVPSGSSQPSGPSRLPEPFQHTISTSNAPVSSTTNSTSTLAPASKHSTDRLLRTPNLPTIVFPHVPASSARSAVHNLPPPADLLSGLETDARPEAQTALVFDDNLGLILPSGPGGASYMPGATLAPMSNTLGREMLTLEKGLLQEPKRGG